MPSEAKLKKKIKVNNFAARSAVANFFESVHP